MANESIPEYQTDVLIVGSGPVGATYARKLVKAGIKVIMVELGAHVIQGELQKLSIPTNAGVFSDLNPESFVSQTTVLNGQNPNQDPHTNLEAAAATRAVGGMTAHWTCCTPEPLPGVERPDSFSDKEWERLSNEARKFIHTPIDSNGEESCVQVFPRHITAVRACVNLSSRPTRMLLTYLTRYSKLRPPYFSSFSGNYDVSKSFAKLGKMSQDWYDNAIVPDGDPEDGCRPEEAQALRLYLDDKVDVAEAARLVTKPTEFSEDPGDDLPNLWGLLQDALIELPNSQQKVVRLISKIRDLPNFDLDSHDKKRSGPLEDRSSSLWHDLPSFANQWYDGNWWYYQNEWRQKPQLYSSPDKIVEITNLARAEALFAHTDILDDRVRYEGLSRLCDTLEDNKAVIEIEIHAVREWLLHARDILYDMSQTPHMHNRLLSNSDIRDKIAKHEMHVSVKDERDLWQGSGGSSLERWNFWKQRLQELQDDDDQDEETKRAVREALNSMR